MINEGKKYISNSFRTIGLTLLAPSGSIGFQYLVFKKSLLAGRTILSLLVAILGFILMVIGYNYVREKENDK